MRRALLVVVVCAAGAVVSSCGRDVPLDAQERQQVFELQVAGEESLPGHCGFDGLPVSRLSRSEAPPPDAITRQLGVLRRPQTAADRAVRLRREDLDSDTTVLFELGTRVVRARGRRFALALTRNDGAPTARNADRCLRPRLAAMSRAVRRCHVSARIRDAARTQEREFARYAHRHPGTYTRLKLIPLDRSRAGTGGVDAKDLAERPSGDLAVSGIGTGDETPSLYAGVVPDGIGRVVADLQRPRSRRIATVHDNVFALPSRYPPLRVTWLGSRGEGRGRADLPQIIATLATTDRGPCG